MELVSLLTIAIGTFFAFSLAVVGLLEAPWPVLLGGMLFTLFGLQRVSGASRLLGEDTVPREVNRPNTGTVPQPDANQLVKEDLTYRGIHYNCPSPSSQKVDSQPHAAEEIIYRGQKVRKPKPEEKPFG